MVDRLPVTEPVTITPPRRLSTPTIRQEWKDVAFVHWPIEPAAVGRLLPRRVRPDVLDGTTYVGLIGLRIRTSLGGVLPVPWLGTFDETHLRLYSVDGTGRRGGVFLTLNADRLITAAFARSVLRIPYTWSPSTIARREDVMTYTTTRRWPNRPTTLRFAVRIGEPCPDPTPLERFVTARWSMHSSWLGQTMRVDATHPPWPLFRAELVDLELPGSFLDEVGLARPDRAPASVLWSPGVRSNLGWPVPV